MNTAGFPDSSISSTSPSVTDRPAEIELNRILMIDLELSNWFEEQLKQVEHAH